MGFLSAVEIAELWGISERSVRNYCSTGRVPGAFLVGKTWNIPADASHVSKSGVRLFPYYLLAYIMPPLYKP